LGEAKLFQNGVKGIWIATDELQTPDIIVYYCHGGGFSMGSAYFYLEFLIAWLQTLKDSGFRNPAIFALEYTLVPDKIYPTQMEETMLGYQFLLSIVDSSRICVSGDSAGGTLILSLLLHLGMEGNEKARPGFALLISPWTMLVSPKNRDTPSDYLNAESLHLYGSQYSGHASLDDPLVSPGVCKDPAWWFRASPTRGFGCVYGSEEVFGPEIKDWIHILRKSECKCTVLEEPDGVHAWPVVALFLGEKRNHRLHGLVGITRIVRQRIGVLVDGKDDRGPG
jgi:acetyl esterase/lipase